MAQDQILVVYSGMENAAKYYTDRAGELRDMIKKINGRNEQLVTFEWNGEAAVAFRERFISDHAQKMESVAEALDEIAGFIYNYLKNRQSEDTAQAGQIR